MPTVDRQRRVYLQALAAAGSLSLAPASTRAQSEPSLLSLQQLTAPLVGNAPLRFDGVRLELPALADNGYVVPLRVVVASPMTAADHVTHIWLLSPRNPVARMAVFHLGPWSGRAEIATRVRLAVLNAAADKAGWGKPLPAGVFRGVAQFMGYGSYTAAVAEVSLQGNAVSVKRIVLATNCGHALNPDQIAAQVEGSVAYGMDSLLCESSVANGRIVERNFDTYPVARLKQMPKVETVIAPSFDFWGGVSESTICVVAPSIMNAIAAACGKPVRNLPLKHEGLRIV